MERLTKRIGKNAFISDEKYLDIVSRAYNKLAEYEDLEEQGRLIKLPAPLDGVEMFELEGVGIWLRLPCHVGDPVYSIEGVTQKGYEWKYSSYEHAYVKEGKFRLDMINSIGVYYFLTKDEAENELAKNKALEMG